MGFIGYKTFIEFLKVNLETLKAQYLPLKGTKSDLDMNGKSIENLQGLKHKGRIDVLSKEKDPEKLNIRIGIVDADGNDISTGIQLEQGSKLRVLNADGNEIISLSPGENGTPNHIRGNETLKIESEDGSLRFASDDAGITYEEATWTEKFKQFVMETSKGIEMVGKNNSYWWVDAVKKAVYGNSANKLEFRTDGVAKFSGDVAMKNVNPSTLWGKKESDFGGAYKNVLSYSGATFTEQLKNAIESNDGFTPIYIPAGEYEIDHTIKIHILTSSLRIIGEDTGSTYTDQDVTFSDFPHLCIGLSDVGDNRGEYIQSLQFENIDFNIVNPQLVYYRDQEYNDISSTKFVNCSLTRMNNESESCTVLKISSWTLEFVDCSLGGGGFNGDIIEKVTDFYGGNIARKILNGCSLGKSPNGIFKQNRMYFINENIESLFGSAESVRDIFSNSPIILVPDIYFGNVRDLTRAFYNCSQLLYVGEIDYGSYGNTRDKIFDEMFSGNTRLVEIKGLCFRKVVSAVNTFKGCKSLEKITIIDDISVSGLSFADCTKLSHDSLLSIINALTDFSGTETTNNIIFGEANLAKLSDEEKAMITEKQWTYA